MLPVILYGNKAWVLLRTDKTFLREQKLYTLAESKSKSRHQSKSNEMFRVQLLQFLLHRNLMTFSQKAQRKRYCPDIVNKIFVSVLECL